MVEFTVGELKDSNKKLNAMQQFHVARRLGTTAVNSLGAIIELLAEAGSLEALLKADVVKMVPVMAQLVKAIGEMSDSDSDYVVMTCLSSVSRSVGSSYAPIQAPGGGLMYVDIELAQMLQIVAKVLEDNFSSFFSALPSLSPGAVAGVQT